MRAGQAVSRVQGSRTDHVGDLGVTGWRALARDAARRAPVLRELYQTARTPRRQFAGYRDELVWQRGNTDLRELPRPASDAPVVVLVTPSDQRFDVKMRVVLSAGLRLEGWRAVVLTPHRRSSRLVRLFRAAGVEDFVFLEEVELSAQDKAAAHTWLSETFQQPQWTFGQVREWQFGNSWIGPQILASVSRRLLDGAPDPADPAVRAEIANLLPQAVSNAQRALSALEALPTAKLAILDEYNYTVAGPVVDQLVVRNVPVISARSVFNVHGVMPSKLVEATRRMHHATVTAESLNDLMRHAWTDDHEQRLQAMFQSRYSQANAGLADFQPTSVGGGAAGEGMLPRPGSARKTAVIFSHVLWDANLFYGEDLFDGFGDWLVRTVEAACLNADLDWIVKLHPANISKAMFHGSNRLNELELLDRHVGALPAHVRLMHPEFPISTLELYKAADFGITVRGTPGLEMPCFGKPALTAGTGRYEGLGFTMDSSSRGEYLERLGSLHTVAALSEAEVLRAKWHAHALFELREWVPSSYRIEPARTHPSVRPANIHRVAGRDSLMGARDIGAITNWMSSGSFDFISSTADRGGFG